MTNGDPSVPTDGRDRIKAAIRERAGDYLTCSIGIAPNTLLAKVAADMKKPDGLTVIDQSGPARSASRAQAPGLPRNRPADGAAAQPLRHLRGRASCVRCPSGGWPKCGGARSSAAGGIGSCAARMSSEPRARRQTVSHSHILPPDLRTDQGSYGVLVRLTHKAAARMRKIGYWAGRGVGQCGIPRRGADRAVGLEPLGLERLAPRPLLPGHAEHPAGGRNAVAAATRRACRFRWEWCSRTCDPAQERDAVALRGRSQGGGIIARDGRGEREFGASVVHFGAMHGLEDAAPNRIAFTQIPDFDRRVS